MQGERESQRCIERERREIKQDSIVSEKNRVM